MIKVEQLCKSYGENVAVDGLSFTIRKGEAFGLLGPNGAGKTTTIHMLTGALKPNSGYVSINGVKDPTQPFLRRKIGVAPQDLALYPELTGEENVRFFGQLYGIYGKKLKEKSEWALDFVSLLEHRDQFASTYSGGMKRRLNLACALLHDPEVIFFDEPTVGVDPQSRNQLFDNIEKLKEMGRTILYTTHYMEEAQRLCDRVAILDHGKLLALDTVENLIDSHGGKSVVEIHFQKKPNKSLKLPGTLKGNHLRAETEKPLELIAELASKGLEFQQLKVERADLETVFLNLTGRSLRDS